MKPGDRYRARNNMFWRADTALKRLERDPRWAAFHRSCGRCGLFFDDIDPLNDNPRADVTDKMRGRGYSAVAFRVSEDRQGFYIQIFVARGTGQDPVAAVRDAYHQALAAGDAVQPGLDAVFDTGEYVGPALAAPDPIAELIG